MNIVFILIALTVVTVTLLIVFTRLNPAWMARHGRVAGGIGLMGVALVLTFVGRIALGLPLAFLAMMLIFGPAGAWRGVSGPGRASRSGGRTSRVRSKTIDMEMDHDTGDLQGTAMSGEHAGRDLSELSLEQLLQFRLSCEQEDPEGAALLDAYLDALHPDWREAAGVGAQSSDSPWAMPDTMERAAAFEVLGLEEGASDEDIREAHRRLMKKLHPDQGGSTFLATQINAAKDALLGANS